MSLVADSMSACSGTSPGNTISPPGHFPQSMGLPSGPRGAQETRTGWQRPGRRSPWPDGVGLLRLH